MQAWQKEFGSKIPVRNEVPVPSAPVDGVLIKIHAAGVCHSDVALSQQEPQPPGWPAAYTLGHEGCGEVVEVGSSVSNFKVGDMVAILSVPGCGKSTCYRCVRGVPQICEEVERYGIGSNGSYAPYIAVKERAVAKLPDGVSPEVGAVATDACMTAYHAVVGTGQLKKDETVVIVGIGGLGFNAMQIAQAIGARVIVTDRRQEVLDEAVKFGIPKEDVVPTAESLVEFVKKNSLLIDTIVDFVGVPETFSASQEAGMWSTSIFLGFVEIVNFICSTIRWEASSGGPSCISANHQQLYVRSQAIVDTVQLWRNYGRP
jgi:propanol-preferring alcohol dehydrogenase